MVARALWLVLFSTLTVTVSQVEAATPRPAAPVLVSVPGDDGATLLGVVEGGKWTGGPAAARRIRGGEVYRLQGLGGPAHTARGGRAVSFGEPCPETFGVSLTPATSKAAFLIGTSATWPARPRPVTSLPTNSPVYEAAVRAELLRRGLRDPRVQLRSVTRADLDGDGTDEVLVEASRFADQAALYPPPTGQPGDYSLLLLRSVVKGKVRTTVLGAYVALKAYDQNRDETMPLAQRYALGGVADLNGDGRMEVVTFSAYYEGYGVAAQEWTPGSGLKVRLDTGCGA
ncbi:hypothetical protein [Deinococcus hopiensis]|uniref:Repeat domain-containing protein n=1 Tax=Deinococcus hopiensis KR-140 TaxID=695939 RepID=A0A1W1VP78_9DEIO|nr:hypothetical protein [Deinococcus hopiensis]SMB95040.1 hypothetical protein SAMN00790413_02664 [Deinococcus hopiensis KR-140]